MTCADVNCGNDRESKMIMAAPDAWCDPCIVDLVAALNTHGLQTVASCCGHGHRPGVIALADGRELVIARDWDEARKIDALFPVDINGDRMDGQHAGWQPIETAPTDGTPIIAWWPHLSRPIIAWFNRKGAGRDGRVWRCSHSNGYTSQMPQPTHWQPLPEPPK